jgi:hypothetical protein
LQLPLGPVMIFRCGEIKRRRVTSRRSSARVLGWQYRALGECTGTQVAGCTAPAGRPIASSAGSSNG